MDGRQCLAPEWREEWQMKKVPVEMNNVERVSAARHTIEKNQMVGERISALRIKAQRAVARGFKYRIGPRVAAGK
jgi:hypothetical protein